MGALVFVYISEELAHSHAQNAPLEWFKSEPGLGVVPRLLSEICWLHIRRSTFVIHRLVLYLTFHMTKNIIR